MAKLGEVPWTYFVYYSLYIPSVSLQLVKGLKIYASI